MASPDRFARRDREYTRFERDRLSDGDPFERGWRRAARDDFGPRRYRPTWVELGPSLQLGWSGRGSIDVRDRGTFTQLRLQTASGATRIDRVIVRFADGSHQVADLDRRLDRRHEMFEIALDGNNRRIDRIIVVGNGNRRGAIQVFGI